MQRLASRSAWISWAKWSIFMLYVFYDSIRVSLPCLTYFQGLSFHQLFHFFNKYCKHQLQHQETLYICWYWFSIIFGIYFTFWINFQLTSLFLSSKSLIIFTPVCWLFSFASRKHSKKPSTSLLRASYPSSPYLKSFWQTSVNSILYVANCQRYYHVQTRKVVCTFLIYGFH